MSVPEKREAVEIAAQPLEKRPKLDDEVYDKVYEALSRLQGSDDDSDEEEDSEPLRSIQAYCEICHGHVSHKCWDCPNRAKGMGMACIACHGPCKMNKNDPDYDPEKHFCFEMVKSCSECMHSGHHWVDDCPFRAAAAAAAEEEYNRRHGYITELYDSDDGF